MKSLHHAEQTTVLNRIVDRQSGIKEITDSWFRSGWITNGIYKIFPRNWFCEFRDIPVSLEEFEARNESKPVIGE